MKTNRISQKTEVVTALRIRQPIGEYYLTSLPVKFLRSVCHKQELPPSRPLIKDYLGERDGDCLSANMVILAVNNPDFENFNYTETAWQISFSKSNPDIAEINIPKQSPTSIRILDGNRRVQSAQNGDIVLPCAIFFGVPARYQTSLFLIANYPHIPSIASIKELYGVNVEDEPEKKWVPGKLAIFFARKLSKGRIKILAENNSVIDRYASDAELPWVIPMSIAVDGITALFSTRPSTDTRKRPSEIEHRLSTSSNTAPLRDFYYDGNDIVIFKFVENYLEVIDGIFLRDGDPAFRTIAGLRALFKLMAIVSSHCLPAKDFTKEAIRRRLQCGANMKFTTRQRNKLSSNDIVNLIIEEINKANAW